jgi:hypothetical protein
VPFEDEFVSSRPSPAPQRVVALEIPTDALEKVQGWEVDVDIADFPADFGFEVPSSNMEEKEAPHRRYYCPHGRQRSYCKDCGGAGICEHKRERRKCKVCGGNQLCEHKRQKNMCKLCGGASICEHQRQRSMCKECGGSQICSHGRQRHSCRACLDLGICEHGKQRSLCKSCALTKDEKSTSCPKPKRLKTVAVEQAEEQAANTAAALLALPQAGITAVALLARGSAFFPVGPRPVAVLK